MALPATEPFTGVAATLANPPWQENRSGAGDAAGTRNLNKNGSGLGTPTITNGDCLPTWISDTFANDQYTQIVPQFTGAGNVSGYIGLSIRGNTSASNNFDATNWYWFWSDGGSDCLIAKMVSSTFTSLATANATAFTSGDVFKMTAVGTTITVTKNGSQILTATDSAATAGSPGIYVYGVIGTVLVDNWEGGNVTSSGIPPGFGPTEAMSMFDMSGIAAMMR